MAGVIPFAIPILSTQAQAVPSNEHNPFQAPALTLGRLVEPQDTFPEDIPSPALSMLASTRTEFLLLDTQRFSEPASAVDDFLAAVQRREDRSRPKRTSEEEVMQQTYIAYVLMASGVVAGLIGAAGLVTASSVPESRKGTMVLLGVVGLGVGGGIFYWGYTMLDETPSLGATPPPSPVMVTYETTF